MDDHLDYCWRLLEHAAQQRYIPAMLNILDVLFLNLAFAVTFTGVLINYYEKYVPPFIKKGYLYGSFAYQGSEANYLQVLEIPKSYYRHFYLFASLFSVSSLFYMCMVYFLGFEVNKYVILGLKFTLKEYEPSASVATALVAMMLLTVQCMRRLYETYYLQVFAKNSKMNLSHYLAGILHYYACILVAIAQAPLFSGESRKNITWIDTKTIYLVVPSVLIFMWCWHEQYKTNIIFANMRKDKKTGKVVTEDHSVPRGRLFEYVSSPHRMCEVVMYTILLMLIPTKTFFCIYLWVLGNQFQTAITAHDWYKKTFSNYPPNRKAIIPYIF
ncbi:polyprenol reductase [Manduca sexta]|uniref:polyprenol reductase n=1 Tax=Manduca sexta TaxID=7130 RepID=UPI00188F721A|nr:polyprenol reductase [Manduca sexta]